MICIHLNLDKMLLNSSCYLLPDESNRFSVLFYSISKHMYNVNAIWKKNYHEKLYRKCFAEYNFDLLN